MTSDIYLQVLDTPKDKQVIHSERTCLQYEFTRGRQFTTVNVKNREGATLDSATWENDVRPFTAKQLVKWIKQYEYDAYNDVE